MRVVEQLQRTPDIESTAKFSDFFKTHVLGDPNAKDIYDKIAATTSLSVYVDHF